MRSNFYGEKDGRLEVGAGCNITDTVAEGIAKAKAENREIAFDFNGVDVRLRGDSDAALILRDWNRGLRGCIDGAVGPYPAPMLTDIETAHDAEVDAANERRRAAAQAEYDQRAKAKADAVAARLAVAPQIELADAAGWQASKDANQDGYGGAVLTYAEQWARLMQLEMAQGKPLAEIADATSHEADTEGITGFMYGCAVSILSKTWAHGEQLRRWHNLKTQIGTEGERANESGGVLNPALLNIG